jgi:probable F420-dependent oxidoreductase
MRIGFALPQHGEAATREGVAAVAREVESLGFDSVWVWERLLRPLEPKAPYPVGDGSLADAFKSVLGPLETLNFVAAITERVRLGTNVINLPWWNPVLLARQLATIDLLSGGRLNVGLGVGWLPDEYDAAGVPFSERGRRADEALDVLEAVWTTDPVAFEGQYYRVPPSYMGVKPLQKPHPPIYMAAYTPAAMKRTAERANGWTPVGIPMPAVPEMFAQIKQMAAQAGRDPEAMELVFRANIELTDKPLDDPRPEFKGTFAQVVEDLGAVRALGATELLVDPWPSSASVRKPEDWMKLAGAVRESLG